jgi:hypothetical protein
MVMRIPQSPSRKVAQVAVVVMLVTASLTGPAVDQADAIHECDSVDALVAMFSFSMVNEDKCTNSHRAEAIEQMKESDANQTKVDIYQATLQQRASIRSKLNVRENYLQDSQTPAWNKGEAAYMQARENGKTHAIARTEARTTVRDYYARQQINLLENWELMVQQFRYLRNKSGSEDGITSDFMYVGFSRSNTYGDGHGGHGIQGFPTVTVTLANGSTKEVTAIRWQACDDWGIYSGCEDTVIRPDQPGSDWMRNTKSGDTLADYDIHGLRVGAPNEDFDSAQYTAFDRWQSIWTNLTETQDRLNDNIDKFTKRINDGIDNGTVDPANVTSAQTLAQEYSTQYNETGYWAYSVAQLSAMGLSAPDLNGTSQMTVQSGDQTYTGMLMSQEAPDNGTWQVGETYNASTISGMQLMVTLDGNRVELDGEFTIESMTDEGGNSINETSTQTYSYKTTNTTEYVELQQELQQLRQEIEEEEPTGGGGSDGGSQPLGDQTGLVLGGAVVALLLVMASNRD